MALKTKLEFVGTDNTGRVITVKDITGLYDATDNPGGYGAPNLAIADIESILFTISRWDKKCINKLRFVDVSDPDHPDYLTQPTISDIANGIANVEFTSIVLGLTEPGDGLKAFSDGVYDVNMYTMFDQMTGIVANQGDKVITRAAGGLDQLYNEVDYVVINNSAYAINKIVPSNVNSLTLDRPLEDSSTSLYKSYRANVKGINQEASNCCGTQSAAKISTSDCGCADKKTDKLFTVWMYKIAAQLDFNCKNYEHANDLLIGAEKLCKCFDCKC